MHTISVDETRPCIEDAKSPCGSAFFTNRTIFITRKREQLWSRSLLERNSPTPRDWTVTSWCWEAQCGGGKAAGCASFMAQKQRVKCGWKAGTEDSSVWDTLTSLRTHRRSFYTFPVLSKLFLSWKFINSRLYQLDLFALTGSLWLNLQFTCTNDAKIVYSFNFRFYSEICQ